MCTIKLQAVMQGRTYPDAGMELFRMLEGKLETENKIVLDMEGVLSLPSMFLNVSIGRVIEEYGMDVLKQKISFTHIRATEATRLQDYVRRFEH